MRQQLALGRRAALLSSGVHIGGDGLLAQVVDADSRRFLRAQLLDAAAARVRTQPDNHAVAATLLAHEARARRARRGLWTMPAYEVRLPDEVGPYDYGFMLIEWRARRVGRCGPQAPAWAILACSRLAACAAQAVRAALGA